MSAGAIAVLVGIVWLAVALIVAWRVGRRLQVEGERYPAADEWGPAWTCAGCAECSP